MITLVHLYPRHMNIYGDTGNVIVLRQRLRWRGIDSRVVPIDVGDPLPHDAAAAKTPHRARSAKTSSLGPPSCARWPTTAWCS